MSRFLLKIAFDGTNFHGWQVQNNAVTVQQIMCEKLSEMLKTKIAVTGCSRTDSGVHANEFFCHFDSPIDIAEEGFVKGLNALLPQEIAVFDCKNVSYDFHARYNAKYKNYIYRFFDGEIIDPFNARYAYKVPVKLNEKKMDEFCKNLIGTYDFEAFSSSKRTVEDTVRTITDASVIREGNLVILSVTANGFLYNMVRIIAGTALSVSAGKIDPQDTEKLILSKSRELLGATAPPKGLFLNKVIY